jgi:hypothetical protein
MNQSKLIAYNLDFILLQVQQSTIHSKDELIKWRDNLAVYQKSWHHISETESIESLARDVYKEIQAFIFMCDSNDDAKEALLAYKEDALDKKKWMVKYDPLYQTLFSSFYDYFEDYVLDQSSSKVVMRIKDFKFFQLNRQPKVIRTYKCLQSEMIHSINFLELYWDNI